MGYRLRRTSVWLCFSLSVLAGLVLARTGWQLNGYYVWLSGFACALLLRRRTWSGLLLLMVFAVCLGWWRGGFYMAATDQYKQLLYKPTTVSVRALEDGVYDKNRQLTFAAGNIRLPTGESLPGRIQVSGFGLNAVFQGDEVLVRGKPYPTRGGNQARLSYAQLQLIAHHDTLSTEIKRRFAAGLQTALPEPLGSFALGLLIGQRATLPDAVKQDLLMVGLTHIIAVSGYNLTIMLHASRGLLSKRSKRLSVLFSLGLICGFLLLSGLSASIVRAAIVSVLSMWAAYYGRQVKPLNLILLAAAMTAWADPFYIWADASWYLSFLAFYGVLVVAPILLYRVRRWRESLWLTVAVESISAELMTLPYDLFAFGQMSFIALPANVLVVTVVPLAMLLSTLAGLAAMLLPSLVGWFAWPARELLTYMLDLAHLFANLPHVFVENLGFSVGWMISFYALIITLSALLWQRQKSQILL